jgi:hypothetical protein
VSGIGPHDALGLHDFLAEMDQWSTVAHFAWGWCEGFEGPDSTTDMLVVKSWHQPDEPHITLRLRRVWPSM